MPADQKGKIGEVFQQLRGYHESCEPGFETCCFHVESAKEILSDNHRKGRSMEPWRSHMHLILVQQKMKKTIDGNHHHGLQTGQSALLSNGQKLIKLLVLVERALQKLARRLIDVSRTKMFGKLGKKF